MEHAAFFNAHAASNPANCNTGCQAVGSAGPDNQALKDLNPFLAALTYLLVDLNGIARTNVNNGLFLKCFFDYLNWVHKQVILTKYRDNCNPASRLYTYDYVERYENIHSLCRS